MLACSNNKETIPEASHSLRDECDPMLVDNPKTLYRNSIAQVDQGLTKKQIYAVPRVNKNDSNGKFFSTIPEHQYLSYCNSDIISLLTAPLIPQTSVRKQSRTVRIVTSSGYKYVSCSKFFNFEHDRWIEPKKIEAVQYAAHYLPAWNYGDRSKWYFFFESPNLALLSPGKIDEAIKIASKSVRLLRDAINTQLLNEAEWGEKTPFSVGGNLVDWNGPLGIGVGINNVATKTLYDEPMKLRSGDIILKVNDVHVFGERDFQQILINHGLSRKHGITVPVRYTVLRNKSIIEIKNTYFFNEVYAPHKKDMRGLAVWYGVGDTITFGQTPWVLCNGTNAIKAVGQSLSTVGELLKSWAQNRTYDSRKVIDAKYIDTAECEWQLDQQKALAQQKEPNIYVNVQWFGLFTPSAVRLVGKNTVRRFTAKNVSRGMIGKALADGGLEAAETALWTIGTSAPGSSLTSKLSASAKFAPLGGAIGFITSAALNYKKRISRKGK